MLGRLGLPRNTRKLWGVTDMFTSWFAEMVSWVYMFFKIINLYTLNMCSLLNINYPLIVLLVKKKKGIARWFLWELSEIKHIKHFVWSLGYEVSASRGVCHTSQCSIVVAVGSWLVSWMIPSHVPVYFLYNIEIICNYLVHIFFVVCLKTLSSLKQRRVWWHWGVPPPLVPPPPSDTPGAALNQ